MEGHLLRLPSIEVPMMEVCEAPALLSFLKLLA